MEKALKKNTHFVIAPNLSYLCKMRYRRDYSGTRKSSAYKNQKTYIDIRNSADNKQKNEIRLIFGDELVRTETFTDKNPGIFTIFRFATKNNFKRGANDNKRQKHFEEKMTGKKFVSTPDLIKSINDYVLKKKK